MTVGQSFEEHNSIEIKKETVNITLKLYRDCLAALGMDILCQPTVIIELLSQCRGRNSTYVSH